MIVILIPLLVAIIGAFIYAFAANPKLVRIGEILLFCGVLWTVYALMGQKFAI